LGRPAAPRTPVRANCEWDSAARGSRPESHGRRLRGHSQIQRFKLFEHVADARSNQIALVAQRLQFGGYRFARGKAGAQRFELARQPLVFFRLPGLFGFHPIDQADEPFDLVFEAIDGLELDAVVCRFRHGHHRSKVQRCTAPCWETSAARILSKACCTSASVNVRSLAWNVRRTDRLTDPSGTPFPLYRSKKPMAV